MLTHLSLIILLAPIIVSRADFSLALNALSIIDVDFININGEGSGEALTIYAGTKTSVKCSGKGNGPPTWSWKFTNFYTELTGYSSSTQSLDGLNG